LEVLLLNWDRSQGLIRKAYIDDDYFTFILSTRSNVILNVSWHVVLGDRVVIVLVIRPKVRGIKPGRGRWIFKGEKILRTTSFEGEEAADPMS
jgi:hypothetical protein